jgi:hypothetical protein
MGGGSWRALDRKSQAGAWQVPWDWTHRGGNTGDVRGRGMEPGGAGAAGRSWAVVVVSAGDPLGGEGGDGGWRAHSCAGGYTAVVSMRKKCKLSNYCCLFCRDVSGMQESGSAIGSPQSSLSCPRNLGRPCLSPGRVPGCRFPVPSSLAAAVPLATEWPRCFGAGQRETLHVLPGAHRASVSPSVPGIPGPCLAGPVAIRWRGLGLRLPSEKLSMCKTGTWCPPR